ncbi:MAG: (deoxy)nucleoside triphosphate pyrophosphohydrolase [Desulfovibrio sp.]|jgi:8-oxo-dGTP diphosphatase|nr:(deoxy)nucleoside triphosphate pyrophosphohydrolase [Desulfovibrio sp.]
MDDSTRNGGGPRGPGTGDAPGIPGKAPDGSHLKVVRVVGAIIVDGERILATQRGGGEFAGMWEFPGGKIEPGESPEEALVREIREELDAEIAIRGYFDTAEHDYPTFHLSMRCYLCTLPGGAVSLREHSAAKWVGRSDAENLPWLPADLPILRGLVDKGVI